MIYVQVRCRQEADGAPTLLNQHESIPLLSAQPISTLDPILSNSPSVPLVPRLVVRTASLSSPSLCAGLDLCGILLSPLLAASPGTCSVDIILPVVPQTREAPRREAVTVPLGWRKLLGGQRVFATKASLHSSVSFNLWPKSSMLATIESAFFESKVTKMAK
jgi:hypothetical protein